MAANLRGYVLPSEADRIVAANYPALRPAQRRDLLETMRTNGLIEEDAIWYSTRAGQHKSRVVYRLPYQRFSDHLIARHLLKAYLDVSSPAAIKSSFAATSPLGRVFHLTDKNFGHYAEPGWAQALITEFPERVGQKIPPEHRELFFALPSDVQDLNAYFEPFLEGIFWRNPTSFTEGRLDTVNMTRDAAAELVVLFSLVLTTVVCSDRDLATKALVLIGEQYPDVLFSHVVACLDFNDPYLPERMLAAAYGTTLSLVDSKKVASFRPLLGELAQKVYLQMFAPRARHATHHALMRDYALGIIEVAQRAECVKLPKTSVHYLSRPFPNTPSPFTSDGTPDESVKDAIGRAIQMDFGNYTIGRLIPNRSNYDDTMALATNEFLGRLRDAWHSRLELIFGVKHSYAGPGDVKTLVWLESRRNTTVERDVKE